MVKRSDTHKEVLNERTDAALERYGHLTNEFENARDKERSNEQGIERSAEGRGSEMVKNDSPSMQPRPPSEIARPVDRESFDERWSQEQDRAGDQDRGDDNER